MEETKCGRTDGENKMWEKANCGRKQNVGENKMWEKTKCGRTDGKNKIWEKM